MQVENWAKERNILDRDSTEFKTYLICFILKYPEKATPEMWVAFAFAFFIPVEC